MENAAELERVAERFAEMSDTELGRRFIKIEAELAAWRSRMPRQKAAAHERVDELAARAVAALTEKIGELRFYAGDRNELFLSNVAGLGDLLAATDPEILKRVHEAIDAPVAPGQADPFGDLGGWQLKRDTLYEEYNDLALERDRRVLARSEAAAKASREAVEAKIAG